MNDQSDKMFSEINHNKLQHERSRKIFKSEKVAEEFIAVKKIAEVEDQYNELMCRIRSNDKSVSMQNTYKKDKEDANKEAHITKYTKSIAKGLLSEMEKGKGGEPAKKRKVGRPKGSKSKKKHMNTLLEYPKYQYNDLIIANESRSMFSPLAQHKQNLACGKSAPFFYIPTNSGFYESQKNDLNFEPNSLSPVLRDFKDYNNQLINVNSMLLYNLHRKTFFTNHTCRTVDIDSIPFRLNYTHANVLPEFKRLVKQLNSYLQIPLPEKFDYAILKDMFIMAIRSAGFFDSTLQRTFFRILKKDYHHIIDKYIEFILPFEQFHFDKPIIEIFSKFKLEDSKRYNIAAASNIPDKLFTGSLYQKIMRIQQLKIEKIDRKIVYELVNVYITLFGMYDKRNKKFTWKDGFIQTEKLDGNQIALSAELCLSIIIEYIQRFDFCDLNVITAIKYIKQNKNLRENWNYCISYIQIMKLIKTVAKQCYKRITASNGINLGVFNSFGQLVEIVTRFYFLIDFDKEIYKIIMNNANPENITGIFLILSKYNTSKNTRRKIFKKIANTIEDLLYKFNYNLYNNESIENSPLLENIVRNIADLKKYNLYLENIHRNILKYNIDQKYKSINKVVFKSLLEIFKVLSGTNLYGSNINIEMLWSASQITGYKEPVTIILKRLQETINVD